MKLLAIAFGIRRIGVSISDPTGTLVRPLVTIDRKVTNKYLEKLISIIEDESVEKIIFGLPLDHDDNETEMCANVRAFSKKLLKLLPNNFHYDFQDESFSSVRTHALLNRTKPKKKTL